MTAMNVALASLVGPEFLVSGPVQTAIVVGGGAALVSAVIGVFTVMRGQSFAGHALADVSSAGGAASLLLGIGDVAGKYYFPTLGPFVIYTIMIVILIWRPNGLFGRTATR